jgi:hypothetical protein
MGIRDRFDFPSFVGLDEIKTTKVPKLNFYALLRYQAIISNDNGMTYSAMFSSEHSTQPAVHGYFSVYSCLVNFLGPLTTSDCSPKRTHSEMFGVITDTHTSTSATGYRGLHTVYRKHYLSSPEAFKQCT